MKSCIENHKNCGAECCKTLSFIVGEIGESLWKYYITRGCKVETLRDKKTRRLIKRIIVPHRCNYLGDDNLCKLHNSDMKPVECTKFGEKTIKGYYIPKECRYATK